MDFQTFIQWIVDMPNKELNEHFAPMIELSQPCRVRYHYYGNFKRLSSEMKMITDKLGVPQEYFRNVSRNHYTPANMTSNFMKEYYSTISTELKGALFRDYIDEFNFYYSLFPEERKDLVELLGCEFGE